MEKMFLKKLDDAEKELSEVKHAARESEKSIQLEVKIAKEEKAKSDAAHADQVEKACVELIEVREARDNSIQENNKLELCIDV